MIQSMYQESTFQGIRFVQFIAQQSNLSWNFLLLDEKMLSDKLKFYSYVIRTQPLSIQSKWSVVSFVLGRCIEQLEFVIVVAPIWIVVAE